MAEGIKLGARLRGLRKAAREAGKQQRERERIEARRDDGDAKRKPGRD